MVSTATCAPRNSGKPSRDDLQSSGVDVVHRQQVEISLTITFVVTMAPASLHTRVAALSRAHPRPRTPTSAHLHCGARTSRRRPHRQERKPEAPEEGAHGTRKNQSATLERWENKCKGHFWKFCPTWCFKPSRCQVSEANKRKTRVLSVHDLTGEVPIH